MLEIQSLSHHYDLQHVLHDVSFSVKAGELACLVGPSGCGKSTLLRLIAGLERVQNGTILHCGNMLGSAVQHVPPEHRHIGLVFQHPSLFPHLTVEQNIRFGLRGKSRDEQQTIIDRMLRLIGLQSRAGSYPHELSGGQHQRVALARALAPEPIIMLLDEPFANLDHVLRREIRDEVIMMLKEADIPMIMVTHDPEEALVMADHMILLNGQGHVHQMGSPDTIHNHPKDMEAARFFGHVNAIAGRINGDVIESKLGHLSKADYAPAMIHDRDVMVATRPEGIRIAREGEECVDVVIERVAHTGAGWLVTARLPEGEMIRFHHIYGVRPRVGEQACVAYEPPHIFVFEE